MHSNHTSYRVVPSEMSLASHPRPNPTDTPTPTTHVTGDDPAYNDITIPPNAPPMRSSQLPPREQTYEGRRDAAWFHTTVTIGLVGMMTLWTMMRVAPGSDATVSIANLILHFGAWITGFLALEASVDAWRLHRNELMRYGATTVEGLDFQSRTVLIMGSVAGLLLFANTAMVVSALLP